MAVERRLSVVLELDTGRYSGRIADAGAKLKVFSGSVNSSSKSVQRLERSFETLGNRMSTPVKKLRDYVLILSNIRLAILNVRDIAVGWVGSLLKQSMEVQRLTILMKGLSTATTEFGKNKEAEQNLARLFAMARDNGFQIKELADAYVKLKTGGIDPMNGSLQALTDAVAKFGGDSDVMHRASIAIQQMAGKGVISMEELRQQLGEAVPTAMWDMARAAGMSLQKFTNLVSKGVIQAKPALTLMFQEFERMYGGSGKLIGQTLMGQVEQFKTNVTQLATSFTGMASGQTDNLRAYMEEQRQLFAEGKITREQFDRAMAGGGAGMFGGATEAIREINEAMRSPQAKVAMQQLGAAINSVMQGIISAARFVVEWRQEILGAVKGILIAFAAVKAVQLGRWFYELSVAGKASLKALLDWSQPLPGNIGKLEAATRSWADATRQSVEAHNAKVAAMGRQANMMNTLFLNSRRQIAQLQTDRQQLQQRLQMLAQQRQQEMANLRTAEMLHAANVAQGRDTTRSTMMVNEAQMALGRTRRAEMRTNELLIQTERGLVIAQQQSTRAAVGAAVATSEFNVAATASTVALRAKAAAARVAAGAVAFLGRAMSVALGPIGMIALALYEAANAAGWFENKANRAAEAAARLMQGMASLEDMKKVQADQDTLRQSYKEKAQALNRGYIETQVSTPYGPTTVRRNLSDEDRKRLTGEMAGIQKRFNSNDQALQRGAFSLRQEEVGMAYGMFDAKRQDYFTGLDANYRAGVASGKINEKNAAAEGAAVNAQKLAFFNNQVGQLEAKRANMLKINPQADTRKIDDMIGRVYEARDAFKSMHQPAEQLQKDLIGVGKGSGTAHHKLTDAEKAAKKAATEFENAREKYDRLLDSQKGEIASLEEELAGGDKKGTARFEALKKAGFYADATNKELEEMGKNFAKIDELNEKLTFEKSLGSLRKELSKTAAEATQMWNSLRNGSFAADQRDAQYRSRFANLLEGVTDPERIAQINADIDKVVENIKRADAAEIANGWIESAKDIEASLLDENAARQRNFELEVERQRQLITLTKEGTQERIDAEAAFGRWYKARQEQLQRENESGIIKMSRQWANLGSGIDTVFTDASKNLVDMLSTGELNVAQFAEDVIRSLFKVILQAVIAYGILSALGQTNGQSFTSFMRGGVNQFLGGFNQGTVGAPTHHTGGMIGSGGAMAMVGAHLWNNAQTRHGGGWIGGRSLKPGEVPIIGMEKELVLTEEQQRLLGQQLSGGGAAGRPNVQVNVINNSGTEMEVTHGEPEFNGRDMILSVVMEAAQKQGPFRDVLQNAGKK